MLINVDCGELCGLRSLDLRYFAYVDVVNIALGAHAGDPSRAQYLARLAQLYDCKPCLHPSYPDRKHFGRLSQSLPWPVLRRSLDQQREVLPQVSWLKFHGALYNDAQHSEELAGKLSQWCYCNNINTVITMPEGMLAQRCHDAGLKVCFEGFLDRGYEFYRGTLKLVSRDHSQATLTGVGQMMDRYAKWLEDGKIHDIHGVEHDLPIDTWCIHGDSSLALAALQQLSSLSKGVSKEPSKDVDVPHENRLTDRERSRAD